MDEENLSPNQMSEGFEAQPVDGFGEIQGFAFGGIANPSQTTFLRGSDQAYLQARQKELDAYEAQRQAYNDSLTKWQNEVYNPYKTQVEAYNAEAQKYNDEVYNPYKAQFDKYKEAVDTWNAGPRTTDYAGPSEPKLAREFTLKAPTTPEAFKGVAPTLPFTEADVVAYQKEAAARASRDAGSRAAAIDVVSDPDRFNFGSMSVSGRFMSEGGEVDKSEQGLADLVASAGRHGDTQLAHLSPSAAEMLKAMGGSGTVNPHTGLPEFFIGREAYANTVDYALKLAANAPKNTQYTNTTPDWIKAMYDPLYKKPAPMPANWDKPTVAAPPPMTKSRSSPVDIPINAAPITGGPSFNPTAPARPAAPKTQEELFKFLDESTASYNKPGGPGYALTHPSPAPTPLKPMAPVATLPPGAKPITPSAPPSVKPIAPSAPISVRPVTPSAPPSVRPGSIPHYTDAGTRKDIAIRGGRGDTTPSFDVPDYGIPTSRIPMQTLSVPNFNYSPSSGRAPNPLAPTPLTMMAQAVPLMSAANTYNTISKNSNLSPTMLGGEQNAGIMYDRLGNAIYSPATPRNYYGGPVFAFAKGGLADVNDYNLSDEEDQAINTDPVGSAQQMLQDFSTLGQTKTSYEATPNKVSLKRVSRSPISDSTGTAKGMAMQYESLTKSDLGTMKDRKPEARNTDSSRAQMEELARTYKLKIRAAENKARGLMADTLGAPTLEQPLLTKASLTKKRFETGGEVKKDGAEDMQEPGVFGVSDYATKASARMFPDQKGQDDQRDAARHMLAAGIVARKYGPGAAEFLGKAHERLSNPKSFFNMFGIGEPRYDYNVDVHNNRLGSELAARAKTQAELEAMVQALAKQATNKQTAGRPWTLSREQLEAVDAQSKKAATPPEYRAEGSPEEGELSDAEREAASRPAFVTPKSGKGRKEGSISRQLKSGEAYVNMAKGVTELPYDLVGAPVDLATMALRPFGYGTEKPVMGSDWIKEKMTGAGIRPEPPADSTSKGFYTAGEMLSNLTNPAGVARKAGPVVEKGVKAGAMEVGRQLDRAIMDSEGPLANLVPQAAKPLYVSRAPGGYFPTSRANEGGILSNLDKTLEPVLKSVKEIDDPAKREALSMMFNQKAKDFFTKQAGSIQDPLRADILSGALRFDDTSSMGDVFPRTLQKSVAQGDLQALRLLEKNYDKMIGIKSVVPRRLDADLVENVPESQIMAHMQANLDKIPDAQLLAYAGKKPGPGPTGVADAAAQVREKLQANPTLFSTVLEPRIARTLFPQAQYVTDTDMARFPSLYGTTASEAMTIDHSLQPQTYADKVAPGYFLPDMEKAIEKGQPIMDVSHDRLNLLGMNANKLLSEAIQMAPEELNQMGFADFLKKAYANTQQVDKFESALPKVKKMIQEGTAPPADIMTYGMKDFLPTAGDFRWVKVIKPDGVRAIAAGMNNSVGSYANSTTYGSLNKGRAALDQGEAEIYSLYDKNNVPHVTVEYLTSKPGVPDNKKNTIAQLTGNGPLTGNEVPENYAPQIVDLLNNLRPSTMPLSIKRLLDKTGQKNFLTEEALAPLYFGVPIEALRVQDDNLLRQLGAR